MTLLTRSLLGEAFPGKSRLIAAFEALERSITTDGATLQDVAETAQEAFQAAADALAGLAGRQPISDVLTALAAMPVGAGAVEQFGANAFGTRPIDTLDTASLLTVGRANGLFAAVGSGVTSFNARVGAVILSSSDVTTALTYTPTSVAGLTGAQTVAAFKTGLGLVKADVGLGNVDNTADATKNVLSATKLTTARTLAATGDVAWNSGAFDGSGNVSATATIQPGVVTLAKMADIATARFIGRVTAGTGVPEALTGTQATTLLDAFSSTLKGLAPASGGGVVNFLRADGSWAAIDLSTASVTGTLAAARMPALTGDVTTSAGGVATTIGANKVTLGMMAQIATQTFLGRTTAATGNVEALTISQAKTLLNLTGTNSGDQTITLTGDVTGSGTGSFAATIANDAVTYAKMQNVSATDKVLGRSTAGAGDVEEIAFTPVARTLVAQTTQALMRTTGLGLGTAATQNTSTAGANVPLMNGANTWSAQQIIPIFTNNQLSNTANGRRWYDTSTNIFLEYLANASTANVGPGGNLTSPAGTIVTSFAIRSIAQDTSAAYGWTWETNGPASTTPATVMELNTSGNLYVTGYMRATTFRVGTNQVVGARVTGWSAATGTATRTSFATSTVTLPNLAQVVKAIVDDLMTHGLLGA